MVVEVLPWEPIDVGAVVWREFVRSVDAVDVPDDSFPKRCGMLEYVGRS